MSMQSIRIPEFLHERIKRRAKFRRMPVTTEILEALDVYYKMLDGHHIYWQKLKLDELDFLVRNLVGVEMIRPQLIVSILENNLWDDIHKRYLPDKIQYEHLLRRVREAEWIDKQALCDVVMAHIQRKSAQPETVRYRIPSSAAS